MRSVGVGDEVRTPDGCCAGQTGKTTVANVPGGSPRGPPPAIRHDRLTRFAVDRRPGTLTPSVQGDRSERRADSNPGRSEDSRVGPQIRR